MQEKCQNIYCFFKEMVYSVDVVYNYEHKWAYNKFVGPGGGTRRLHHFSYGDEIGLTATQRRNRCFRIVPSVLGLLTQMPIIMVL